VNRYEQLTFVDFSSWYLERIGASVLCYSFILAIFCPFCIDPYFLVLVIFICHLGLKEKSPILVSVDRVQFFVSGGH